MRYISNESIPPSILADKLPIRLTLRLNHLVHTRSAARRLIPRKLLQTGIGHLSEPLCRGQIGGDALRRDEVSQRRNDQLMRVLGRGDILEDVGPELVGLLRGLRADGQALLDAFLFRLYSISLVAAENPRAG